MKKNISSKKMFILMLVGAIVFAVVTIIGAFLTKDAIAKNNVSYAVITSIIVLFFGFCIILCFVIANQLGCLVWYDEKTNELCRKGIFFGFNYRVSIFDIEKVVVQEMQFQGRFIIFVDKYGKVVEGITKNSFIRLEYNDKNLEFAKSIYKGDITKTEM